VTVQQARRVLQITAMPFPPEIRVKKEGFTLLEAGYALGVMCPPIEGRPEYEVWRGIEVFRPAVLGKSASVVDKLLYQSTYVSPAWVAAYREIIARFRPDVLHVHDIWLGRSAFMARTNQRVVLDLHENMPAAVVQYLPGYKGLKKLFNAIVKPYWRVLRYERSLLAKSDLVLVVVEEAARRVREAHPMLDPARVVNVENLESKDFVATPADPKPLIPQDEFSILYVGGFGPHRGIDTLIRAMRVLKDWKVAARLYLVGAREGADYLEMLRDIVRQEDVADRVEIVGWVPSDMVLSYITQASVCSVPHHSNDHTDSTIPHKLFQYMIAARPVLVSTSQPLARSVTAAGAGAVFIAGDAVDCARKLRELTESPERRAQYAASGYRYVIDQGHNWEEESAPALLAAYARLLGGTEASV
jgi:glycosyltransferase involved in cell wall biosynthesis